MSPAFTGSVSQPTLLRRYEPSSGVTVVINEATPKGWSATASHVQTPRQCYYFWGTVAAVGNATVEGQITCQ